MKLGLCCGHKEQMEIIVAEEMVASFGGEVIHPVLSTVHMVYYMEWVSRKIILPFLEECEEGIGASITVQHFTPAPVGKKVRFIAECIHVGPGKVTCQVHAEHGRSAIGRGEFVQIIMPKEKIVQKITEMSR